MSHDHKRPPMPETEAISASAGSGKTFQMVVRMIRLLDAGVPPERIAAVTFTRKAAGEIFEKLIALLIRWLNDPSAQEGVARELGFPPIPKERLIAHLRRTLLASHSMLISTLDSFFLSVIKAFPFEFGIAGEVDIQPESLADIAARRALKDILWGASSVKERHAFIEEFKKATFGRQEKTIAEQLERFVKENHGKYLDAPDGSLWGDPGLIWRDGWFGKLAAIPDDRLKQAGQELLESLPEDIKPKIRARFVDFVEFAVAYTPETKIEKSPAYLFFRAVEAWDRLESDRTLVIDKKELELTKTQATLLRSLTGHVLRRLIDALAEATDGLHRILSRYDDRVDRLSRSRGVLTFQDALFLLFAASVDRPICGAPVPDKLYIDYRLDSRVDHWMIDEFQDTSDRQWGVMENLIDEVVGAEPGTRSFFYVGDVKQSIYQWRQGDPRLFMAVRSALEERFPGRLSLRTLDVTRRSSKAVIEAVNSVFGAVASGIIPELAPSAARLDWRTHGTANTQPGHVQLIRVPKAEESELIDTKCAVIEALHRRIAPNGKRLTMAVLVRANDTARLMADNLEARGVRTTCEGKYAITDNTLVAALLSLITLSQHPGDKMAIGHLGLTPLADVTADISALTIKLQKKLDRDGFAGLVAHWASEMERRLTRSGASTLDAFHRQRVERLIEAALEYDASGGRDALAFVELVRKLQLPSVADTGTVQVLTVHKSKGLEFDVVVLPELRGNDGIFTGRSHGVRIKRDARRHPEWVSLLPPAELASSLPTLGEYLAEEKEDHAYENLCLLYVAMTRAKMALHMVVEDDSSEKTLRLSDIVVRTLGKEPSTPLRFEDVELTPGSELLYERGSPDWHAAIQRPATPPVAERQVAAVDFSDSRHASAPSKSESFPLKGAYLFSARESSRLLGTALHELLSQIEWIEGCNAAEVAERWDKRRYDLPATTKRGVVKLFHDTLASAIGDCGVLEAVWPRRGMARAAFRRGSGRLRSIRRAGSSRRVHGRFRQGAPGHNLRL